jgi:ethanolamine utilization protein EutP (predicted NTPase)
MELFTATGKLKKIFWQLEKFDVCTTGDRAHIDTIVKFLPHKRQYGCIDILQCCNDPCLCGHVAMVERTSRFPRLPRDLADVNTRFIATVKNIDAPMLKRVWQKLEYRIDVCRVTRGAHIELL